MPRARVIRQLRPAQWGVAAGLALAGAVLFGHGVAAADPDSETTSGPARSTKTATVRSATPVDPKPTPRVPRASAAAAEAQAVSASGSTAASDGGQRRARRSSARPELPAPIPKANRELSTATVGVQLPPMPVSEGKSFAVSPDAIGVVAGDYVAAGGDSNDSARFFFGDLAVSSLDTLASGRPPADRVRAQLGNLAVSGYFGGIWLRDNLRAEPAESSPPATATTGGGGVSAVGIRLFDALAAGLTALGSSKPWVATTAARLSVPVLLTLYGYNRGYLEFLLENPPAGVPSKQDTLGCNGFLSCNSTAFPLEIATRYDGALDSLGSPSSPRWREMAAWSAMLENATGAGRFVWGRIAEAGAFSPASYAALVDLSSAYLMISKAAVLFSMQAYADGDADLAGSALLLQAGLWMWSGAYFAGLASDAPRGTIPALVVSG